MSKKGGFRARLLVLFIILAVVASLFTACTEKQANINNSTASNPSGPSNNEKKGEDQQLGNQQSNESELLSLEETGEAYKRDANGYPQLNGITLTIWMPFQDYFVDVADSYADMYVMKEFMDMLDVKLEFIHPPIGQEKDHFSIMIASDELPDMIFNDAVDSYYPGGVTKAYDDGLLYDYTKLINEKNTPLFIKKVLNDEYLSKGAYDDYGRVIRLGAQVSGSEESCTTMFGIMAREDMLRAAGKENPVTIDDWYALLKALKGNGVQYPLLFDKANYWQTRNAFSNAYGVSATTYYIKEDGTVGYGPYEDVFFDYLTTLHKWYSEGLINPDFMNQDTAEIWSMIADDKGAITPNHLFTYTQYYYTPVESKYPSKKMIALDFPVLKEGDKLRMMVTNRTLSLRKYITADTKYPLACVLLLDALYDDNIEFMMSNGIEGLGYTINEDGYPVVTIISPDLDKEHLLGSRLAAWETESDSDLEYILTQKYCYGVQPDCIRTMIKHSYEGIWPGFGVTFTIEESEKIAELQTDITTYKDEMVLKFITGNEPLANFKAYQEKLKVLGIEELLSIYQDAYNRYLAR